MSIHDKTTAKSQYWATLPTSEIASAIESKFDDHLQWLHKTGLADRMQTSFDQYYCNQTGGFGVEMEDEAISKVVVPHYKNLLSRIHSMTVQAKLSFQPKAINSDSKSQLSTDFAKGLMEWEVSQGMGQNTSQMVEQSLVMFGSYIYAPWDKNAGESQMPDMTGKVIMSGEQKFYNLSAFQCAKSSSQAKSPYYIVEIQVNRYDLLAQHPDKADHILSTSANQGMFRLITPETNSQINQDEDSVTIKVLLHDKTTACPKGRVTVVCNSEVLEDAEFYYQKMPVVEMKASSKMNSVTADSPASSLIGLQQVLDRLYSAQVTNVLNGCISNIYSSDPNLSVGDIRKGQRIITGTSPPAAIALTGQSPDTVNLVNDIINQETLLSGLNNTAKGNPEASLKSGTSLSLILSTAIQYIGPIQQAYAQATAELATIVIKNLQSFCTVKRLAFIAGASNKQMAKEFSAQDVEGVDRFIVELGNPVTQNVSGRMELVTTLIQYGALKDVTKIDDFLRTGNWEALTEDKFSQNIYIREENEMLRKGNIPKVMISDNHPKHIAEALTILDSEEARNDPKIVQAVLSHVQEHMGIWPTVPPAMLAALGINAAPPPPMGPPLPQGPNQPPPGAGGPPPQSPSPPAPNVNGTSLPNGRGIPEPLNAGYQDFAQNISANPAANQPE